MIDRYRGGVPKGVKINQHDYGGIGDSGENHYNSKTLTNQYIIKGMASGMHKETLKSKGAIRMVGDTQEII